MFAVHSSDRRIDHIHFGHFEHFFKAVGIQEYLLLLQHQIDAWPVQDVPRTLHVLLHMAVVEEIIHTIVEKGTRLEAIQYFSAVATQEISTKQLQKSILIEEYFGQVNHDHLTTFFALIVCLPDGLLTE